MKDGQMQRFWSRVTRSGDCLLWQGSKNGQGYGRVNMAGATSILAHRVAWEITRGSIPDGMLVCHSCDNPACCNPDHLFLATHLGNNQDKQAKGRCRNGWQTMPDRMRKSYRYAPQLTSEQVDQIVRLRRGRMSQQAIATTVGCCQSTVSKVLRGLSA